MFNSFRTATLITATMLTLLAGAPDASAQVNADSSLAGVYAVRRVVTSSTCAEVVVGDVATTVWMVQWARRVGYTMDALGPTQFTQFRGNAQGNTLTLTGTGRGSSTMTLTLTRDPDGSISGTETVSTVGNNAAGGTSVCSVVRQVFATRMTP